MVSRNAWPATISIRCSWRRRRLCLLRKGPAALAGKTHRGCTRAIAKEKPGCQQPTDCLFVQLPGDTPGRKRCHQKRQNDKTSAGKDPADFTAAMLVVRHAWEVVCCVVLRMALQRRFLESCMCVRVCRPHKQLRNQADHDQDRNPGPLPMCLHVPVSVDLGLPKKVQFAARHGTHGDQVHLHECVADKATLKCMLLVSLQRPSLFGALNQKFDEIL